jgi:hypothetical protein
LVCNFIRVNQAIEDVFGVKEVEEEDEMLDTHSVEVYDIDDNAAYTWMGEITASMLLQY